ncbi:MAG: DUF2071 domain-containing protein [Planctomycetota bacterium]
MLAKGESSTVGGGARGTFALGPPRGRRAMRQRWRDLLFLHWSVLPEVIQATLPEGLTVDTFDGEDGFDFRGRGWLGVVPFRMEGVRPTGLPAVPWLSDFGELNLRTYVVGPDGTPGVWFYSLDADQGVAVWIARRVFALPYHRAAIRQEDEVLAEAEPRRRVRYFWQRRGEAGGDDGPAFEYDVPGDGAARPAEVGTLAHWLVERYVLYSRRPLFLYGSGRTRPSGDGRLYAGRVDHAAYRVAEPPKIEMRRWDASPLGLNGFVADLVGGREPDHAVWSPGVDVSVYPLERVRLHSPPPEAPEVGPPPPDSGGGP